MNGIPIDESTRSRRDYHKKILLCGAASAQAASPLVSILAARALPACDADRVHQRQTDAIVRTIDNCMRSIPNKAFYATPRTEATTQNKTSSTAHYKKGFSACGVIRAPCLNPSVAAL